MNKVTLKFVLRLLNPDQKENRIPVCQDVKQSLAVDLNLLSMMSAGDETWVYGYGPETRFQSSQWKIPRFPRPKKARQSK